MKMRNGSQRRSMMSAMSATVIALHLGAMSMLVGCTSGPALPTTPNLYRDGDVSAMTQIAPDRRTIEVDILYGTDREPNESRSAARRYYDERRSHSLAVGNVSVRFGEDLSWDDLVRESLDPKGRRVPLEIVAVEELVRFPSSVSLPVRAADGELDDAPEFIATRADAEQAVRDEVSRRLASADRKEVFVYIHGVGNSFSDPMYRMAELWHFLGRPGVPVVYTWPAIKGGGPLRGYTYARESSEFTVYHLRQFLHGRGVMPRRRAYPHPRPQPRYGRHAVGAQPSANAVLRRSRTRPAGAEARQRHPGGAGHRPECRAATLPSRPGLQDPRSHDDLRDARGQGTGNRPVPLQQPDPPRRHDRQGPDAGADRGDEERSPGTRSRSRSR